MGVRFTLDHNCIIDLEDEAPRAVHVRALAAAAQSDEHAICISASSGAELLRDKSLPPSFSILQRRLERLGLAHAMILEPLLRVGMGFVGFGLVSGPELADLEHRIRQILFPTMPDDYRGYVDASSDRVRAAMKWINARLDVDTMWAHIYHRCDVFVTSDRNFLKASRRAALLELGAREIATPEAAAGLVS